MSIAGVLVFSALSENHVYCLSLHYIFYIVVTLVPISEPGTLHKL